MSGSHGRWFCTICGAGGGGDGIWHKCSQTGPSLIFDGCIATKEQDLDGIRYRWLRDKCDDADIRAGLSWLAGPLGLDAAIDAEIKRGKS